VLASKEAAAVRRSAVAHRAKARRRRRQPGQLVPVGRRQGSSVKRSGDKDGVVWEDSRRRAALMSEDVGNRNGPERLRRSH